MNGSLPKHVAIIMDGNGRWAKSRGLPRTQGHVEGMKRAEEIVSHANRIGIQALTLFTFSTENWTRPQEEVSLLMNLLSTMLAQKTQQLKKDNIRFQTIGRRAQVPEAVLKVLDTTTESTKSCTGMVMNLAFNYGSRLEIIDAIRTIVRQVQSGRVDVEAIDEKVVSDALYTAGLPDPDLLIRTSGEKRISNFLLWQLSYAEFVFLEKHWPDFHAEDFDAAIVEYQRRERRFGDIQGHVVR